MTGAEEGAPSGAGPATSELRSDGGPVGRREVAYRLFAAEYDDADLEYSDSEEERAPNYVVTPTGARVNRLFVVGVLTEVESVSDDVLRARVVDPTGAFVVYAGQYQPEAVTFLEAAEVPSFVAVTGKARTFQPEDADRVFTSVRPESVTTVDAATRDRWTVQAAEHTLARVATMARAIAREERGEALEAALVEAGVAPGLAGGVALAVDHYGTTPAYLAAVRDLAIAAAAVVAGEREEVSPLDVAPDEGGATDVDLTAGPAVYGTLTDGAAFDLEAPSAAAAPAAPGDGPPEAEPPADADATPAEARADEATSPADDLGDFDDHEAEPEAPRDDEDAAEAAPEEPGLYELDDEEREAVEAEYGTEFSTGGEVGEPGEAGIEPEADQSAAEPPATAADEEPDAPPTDEGVEGAPAAADEAPSDDELPADEDAHDAGDGDDEAGPAEATDDGEPPADVDLEDAVVAAMEALDEGDGADREAVVASVVDEHGADPEAVEAAIQDALMGGRCYEPADGTLTAI